MTHINAISSGQGAPSTYMIYAAGMGKFPADVVIVADTGWENDMLWSNGRRTDAKTFFEEVTRPLANKYGMDAYFVRAQDENGDDLPPLSDVLKAFMNIPLFGSNGGRRRQTCTDKWKKRAIKQQLRRLGAKTATSYLGITMDEVHRMKRSNLVWNDLAYPLVMGFGMKMYKAEITKELDAADIPYLVSSECDGCPHKDLWRWQRTAPHVVDELEEFEATFEGEFFLTKHRIPLRQAIELMESRKPDSFLDSFLDSCDSGYCFT